MKSGVRVPPGPHQYLVLTIVEYHLFFNPVPDKRYWDCKRSIADVAQYIIDNDLWEKIKAEIG